MTAATKSKRFVRKMALLGNRTARIKSVIGQSFGAPLLIQALMDSWCIEDRFVSVW